MENESVMGQLIPFERSAESLRRLAAQKQRQGNFLKALELLRLSQAKEPQNAETRLEIAKAYERMHCPGLSNRALFALFSNEQMAAESFFLAGCNFFAMRMEESARDCFVLTLKKQPDGPFAPEAVDMIEEVDGAKRLGSEMDLRINRRINRALDALSMGKPGLAVRLIGRVLSLEARNGRAHALMAFALLSNGNAEDALKSARHAMRLSGEDVHALCAAAASLFALGSRGAATSFLKRALSRVESEEDAELVCQTACDIQDHACAHALLKKMEGDMPLSDGFLHLLAAASFNLGDTAEALRCWRLLRRIDPMDMVAEQRLRLAESGALGVPVSYLREVPQGVVLSSLHALRAYVRDGTEGLTRFWREDEAFERLIRWGLYAEDPGIPEAMMGLLSTIRHESARGPLQDLLSSAEIPDDRKRGALAALCMLGAGGPHYALIDNRITLVHVSRADQGQNDSQAEALSRHVQKRLGGLRKGEQKALESLCRAALSQEQRLGGLFRVKGVEMALRMLRGEDIRETCDRPHRRRLIRFARRIFRAAAE